MTTDNNGQVLSRGCWDGTGKPCTTNLTDNTFRFDGTEHRITHFTLSSGYLSFKLNKNLAGEKRRLVLVVDGERFWGRECTFDTGGSVQLSWTGSGLAWSTGDTVPVSLVEIPTTHLKLVPNPLVEGTAVSVEVCLHRGLAHSQGPRILRSHVPRSDVTIPLIVTAGTAEEEDYEGSVYPDGTRRPVISINLAHHAVASSRASRRSEATTARPSR